MNTRMMFARAVAGAAMLGLAGCASRPNIEEFAFVPCDGATTAEIARLAKVSGGTDDRVWNINKDRDRAAENAAVWYESTPIRFGTNMVCVAVAELGRKGSPIQIADAVFRSQILCRHDAGHSIILQCAAAFGRGENERLLVVKPNATYRNEIGYTHLRPVVYLRMGDGACAREALAGSCFAALPRFGVPLSKGSRHRRV